MGRCLRATPGRTITFDPNPGHPVQDPGPDSGRASSRRSWSAPDPASQSGNANCTWPVCRAVNPHGRHAFLAKVYRPPLACPACALTNATRRHLRCRAARRGRSATPGGATSIWAQGARRLSGSDRPVAPVASWFARSDRHTPMATTRCGSGGRLANCLARFTLNPALTGAYCRRQMLACIRHAQRDKGATGHSVLQ